MLAFYMDQQVRGRITRELRRRGIDVLTAFEDGRASADDDDLLDRASLLERVFDSQYQDLLRVGRQRQRDGQEFFGIAFLKQDPINLNRAIEYLELIAKVASAVEMRNHIEYVPTF
jgi:hypothetical protein